MLSLEIITEIITAATEPYAMKATANRFSCKPPLRKLAMEDASICKLTVKMNSTNQQKNPPPVKKPSGG